MEVDRVFMDGRTFSFVRSFVVSFELIVEKLFPNFVIHSISAHRFAEAHCSNPNGTAHRRPQGGGGMLFSNSVRAEIVPPNRRRKDKKEITKQKEIAAKKKKSKKNLKRNNKTTLLKHKENQLGFGDLRRSRVRVVSTVGKVHSVPLNFDPLSPASKTFFATENVAQAQAQVQTKQFQTQQLLSLSLDPTGRRRKRGGGRAAACDRGRAGNFCDFHLGIFEIPYVPPQPYPSSYLQ